MATLTNFDIPAFADQALQGFVNTLIPIPVFSASYSSAAVETNTQVLVPLIANVTATTFNGSYSVSGGTASVITVTINKHKINPISITDLQRASSSGKANAETWAYQQGVGLATLVLQDIWSMLTTSNFAIVTTVASTAMTIAELRKGRLQLKQNKVPQNNVSFVLDNVPYDTLLGITNFLLAYAAGDAQALRDGRVGQALGCQVFETNALPGTNSIMGFIAHPSSMAVAMRYLNPGDAGRATYLDARPVEDPGTGITMGLRHYYDFAAGTEYVILESNYGYAAGLTQGCRLYGRTD